VTSNNKKGQITDEKSNMTMSKFIVETFFDRDLVFKRLFSERTFGSAQLPPSVAEG
jgi:hypothetical protein